MVTACYLLMKQWMSNFLSVAGYLPFFFPTFEMNKQNEQQNEQMNIYKSIGTISSLNGILPDWNCIFFSNETRYLPNQGGCLQKKTEDTLGMLYFMLHFFTFISIFILHYYFSYFNYPVILLFLPYFIIYYYTSLLISSNLMFNIYYLLLCFFDYGRRH